MKLFLKTVQVIDQKKTAMSAREDRLGNGLSLRKLAAKFEPPITVAYLSKLETGERDWNADLVERFNEAIKK